MATDPSSEQITSGIPPRKQRHTDSSCLKCGSVNVADGISVDAEGGVTLSTAIPRNPGAWISTMLTAREVLLARVCGDCGHVEFYVKDPTKLVELAAEVRRLEEQKI
jgi:hypothetical protein